MTHHLRARPLQTLPQRAGPGLCLDREGYFDNETSRSGRQGITSTIQYEENVDWTGTLWVSEPTIE